MGGKGSKSETDMFPTAAKFEPVKIEGLEEGETKYWCRCGLSKNQPWCDGSHDGTGITPLPWTVDKKQDAYYMCACKQTKNPPFCDGSHTNAKELIASRAEKCQTKDKHMGNVHRLWLEPCPGILNTGASCCN